MAGGGTLTDYGGYAQEARANNSTLWSAATVNGGDVEKSLDTIVAFSTPSSNASGNAGGCAIWADAARTSLIARLTFPATPLQTSDLVALSTDSTITFSAVP
jgi:hypothetical protein